MKFPGKFGKRRIAWLAVVLALGGAALFFFPRRGRPLPPPDTVVLVTIGPLSAALRPEARRRGRRRFGLPRPCRPPECRFAR